jgi:hypothetical protein
MILTGRLCSEPRLERHFICAEHKQFGIDLGVGMFHATYFLSGVAGYEVFPIHSMGWAGLPAIGPRNGQVAGREKN